MAGFCPHQVPSGPISFQSTRQVNQGPARLRTVSQVELGFVAGTLNRNSNILNHLGRVGPSPLMTRSAQVK